MTIQMPRADMLTVLKKLGLTANLRLCLDAGHETSLPAASTTWLDLSGNGYDFFRGTTAASQGTDPTIAGTAGNRSSSEYLSFDGGDFLTYDAANETWMNNLHKDGAKFTVATWVLPIDSGANQRIFATSLSAVSIGTALAFSSGGNCNFLTGNGSAEVKTDSTMLSAANVNFGAWNFIAVSIDEADASSGFIGCVNGTFRTPSSGVFTSPSASNAAGTFRIGASQDGSSNIIAAGSQMASFMMWEGVALGDAQLRAIFQATRGKFGV